MGKLKGETATTDVVVETPTQTEEWDGTVSSRLPEWGIELCKRWFKHDRNDLELRWATGRGINDAYGSPTVRQPHGQQTIKTLAMVLEIDASEISRMRNFAELADTFEQFQREHPDLSTWNRVKLFLSGKQTGEGQKLSEALIRRIQVATVDLKKPAFALDDVDRDMLQLELRKLGRELEARAQIKLTVESVHTDAAA